MGSILVVAEQVDGTLRGASLSAVTFALKIAETAGGADLVGLVIGSDVAEAAKEFAKYGLSRIVCVDDGDLKTYQAETYATVVAEVAKETGATHVVATASQTGKDLLPRAAALLDAGMASDCVSVLGPNRFKRPVVAGNAIATVEVAGSPVVASCRQSEWTGATESGDGAPIEEGDGGDFDSYGAEVLSVETVKSDRPELTDARIVVSGGRGMKDPANFSHLEKLADVLGAAVGATRAVCDAGWVPNDMQVGQTGKVVAPDLYIAVGISGAIQHLAGMKGSKVIVAINKDEEAPIFQVADYGLVAKWEDSLADFTEKVQAAKA